MRQSRAFTYWVILAWKNSEMLPDCEVHHCHLSYSEASHLELNQAGDIGLRVIRRSGVEGVLVFNLKGQRLVAEE